MEPNNSKVANAFRAMKDLGISKERVTPVLKNLLKLYVGDWELIEEDNYRTLVDAIFESAEDQQKEDDEKNGLELDLRLPPTKRLHMELEDDKTSSNKGKDRISSDLALVVSNPPHQRVSAASHPNKAGDRTGIDGKASRMGSAQRNVNIKKETNCTESTGSHSLVVHQPPTHKKKSSRQINDITKGREKWKIPLLDEFGTEKAPKFVYIHQNIIYQDAYIRFSLARIADDDCCLKCSGDCLSYSVPCECARDTGGEFAYTSGGVLREDFLDNCISMNIDPQKHHYVFCTNCPLERAKYGNRPEPCKGHLVRKFIKECWSKCGCNMNCGNRVVQRGISCKLQVFLTKEGKGWGLRALQDLPKGYFVCEYVGEILTNTELYYRNTQCGHNVRHTYPVLLDADWSSERVLEDKDALCLDATHYGNVGRFINHRCYDSNLIDIPVEVETPDHHYYHIAFFTKRKVNAFEELTWDYKIDFCDREHPIKAFSCCCGSKFCRDPKVKDPIQGHPDDQQLVRYGSY